MIDESSSAFKSHPETTSIGEQEASLVTVEVLEELTQDEEQERHRLELKAERAFYEAGAALRELKDKRLYRSTHRTFEEYSKDRFGFQRAHSYRLIEAATVVENLFPTTSPNNLSPNGRQILPTSERQVRDLINLESDQQRQIWQSAVKQSGVKSLVIALLRILWSG